MAIPAWHVALPQTLLMDGYSESAPDVLLRTGMDFGPAQVRRRGTAGPRPVTGSIIVTAAQLATFKTFFNATLLGGALRFSWVDPVDGVTAVEMRFTKAPSWQAVSEALFDISLELEILP
jgi:hypothetical protein